MQQNFSTCCATLFHDNLKGKMLSVLPSHVDLAVCTMTMNYLIKMLLFFSVFFYALAPVPTIIAKRFSEDFSSNASK